MISPFMWHGSRAMPWEEYQKQQAPQFQSIQSPLQGLGMMAQAFANNLRRDSRNYFPSMQGGFDFNPLARFRSGGGGLY